MHTILNKLIYLLLLGLLTTGYTTFGQTNPSYGDINADSTAGKRKTKEYANPSVTGMAKSKGIVFKYEGQPEFGIKSYSANPAIGNHQADIKSHNRFDLKVYVPILNRPHFKLVYGFNYFFEEFDFEATPPPYSFYTNIEERNLKTIGSQLVLLRPINYKNYIVFRLKGDLNGDYASNQVSFGKYLKSTLEGIYGWKRSEHLAFGVGVQLGYTFGRQSIYPVFLYNRTYNPKWGIELLLPARAQVRYNASEKSILYGGIGLDGASYNININPEITGFRALELRRSEARARVRWEREIYDFLWFGLEAGYRVNIQFNAFDGEDRKANRLIKNHLKDASLFSAEIFLVPPKRFLKQ